MTLINLHYKSGNGWLPIPHWGHFLLELGTASATYENAHKRFIVGLALPTRAYAASLVCTGITVGRASIDHKIKEMKRFSQLCDLQTNTALIYRKNGKQVKVFFDGTEDFNGELKLRLRTETTSRLRREETLYLISPKQALEVEFPAKDFSSLPKRPARQARIHYSEFLTNTLTTTIATIIASQSALDTLIIGSLSRLKNELQETIFATKVDEKYISGTLQDIVRVRKFMPRAETYRSDIYFVGSQECAQSSQETPAIVIFDGASSFLKWRNYWQQSHWIVLLDQAESEFDTATQTLNDSYARSAVSNRASTTFPIAPTSIPIIIYQDEQYS